MSTEAVQAAKGGQVEFRAEKAGIVHAGVGKASFTDDALVDNVRAFVGAITRGKPSGVKGTYIKRVSLSSTMGPGVKVELSGLGRGEASGRRVRRVPAVRAARVGRERRWRVAWWTDRKSSSWSTALQQDLAEHGLRRRDPSDRADGRRGRRSCGGRCATPARATG